MRVSEVLGRSVFVCLNNGFEAVSLTQSLYLIVTVKRKCFLFGNAHLRNVTELAIEKFETRYRPNL